MTVRGLAHVDYTFVYDGDGDFGGQLTECDETESTATLLPGVAAWDARSKEAEGVA